MKNIKNKCAAIGLICIGIMPILLERDATCLVLALTIAVPMFFAKKTWVEF